MTNRELIEKLNQFDPDDEVLMEITVGKSREGWCHIIGAKNNLAYGKRVIDLEGTVVL